MPELGSSRSAAVRRVLWGILLANLAVVGAKVVIGFAAGSLAVLGDAIHSTADAMNNILALVVVSLMTAPEPAAKIESFFTRLQTSSDGPGGEESVGAASASPSVERPLLLVNLLRLSAASGGRGWRAYREDLSGFAAGWVIVIVLVAGTALLLSL